MTSTGTAAAVATVAMRAHRGSESAQAQHAEQAGRSEIAALEALLLERGTVLRRLRTAAPAAPAAPASSGASPGGVAPAVTTEQWRLLARLADLDERVEVLLAALRPSLVAPRAVVAASASAARARSSPAASRVA